MPTLFFHFYPSNPNINIKETIQELHKIRKFCDKALSVFAQLLKSDFSNPYTIFEY